MFNTPLIQIDKNWVYISLSQISDSAYLKDCYSHSIYLLRFAKVQAAILDKWMGYCEQIQLPKSTSSTITSDFKGYLLMAKVGSHD